MPAKIIDNRDDHEVIEHRIDVAADDATNPTLGSGEDLSTYKYALIEIVITGTNSPGWTITPLFGSSTSSEYHSGEARAVTANDRFICEVDACDDFYIKTTGKTGTSPVISIYITPYNA